MSYTLSSQDNSITYSGNGGIVAYSVTPISDDDEKAKSENISFNGKSILSSSYTYDKNGNVLTKSYGDNISVTNAYDSKDRITSTTYAGKTTNYTYDSNGQLLSANDATYAYDSRGNITSKTESGITTSFTYNTDGWKDLLVKVNDDDLTYDANGNVLTYGDKKFAWNTGRTLESIVDGDNTYSYTYDENGIRTSKTVNGVTTYYNTDNGVILSQTDGESTWYFQYDTNGTPLGFVLNGTQYFYITNQMGDVLAITDTEGNIVGNYEYDAWGKVLTADTDIAKQNPLRYRGYYYDNETDYYYLQSRYYDSNICRFINADIPEIAKISKSISSGLNIFAYCNNEPINTSDPTGHFTIKISRKMVGSFLDMLLSLIPGIGGAFAPIKTLSKCYGLVALKVKIKGPLATFIRFIANKVPKVVSGLKTIVRKIPVFGNKIADKIVVKKLQQQIASGISSAVINKAVNLLVKNIDLVLSLGGALSGVLDYLIDSPRRLDGYLRIYV